MEEELFTSPQFLRSMGAGGAKPLLTKVISPLCSFFLANLFTCWLSHSTTSPQRWSAFIYIYKSIFIIHWTFKHLKAVRGCFKFFGQNRKTVLYQTIQHYPLTIHVGVQQQKPAQTLSLEKKNSFNQTFSTTHPFKITTLFPPLHTNFSASYLFWFSNDQCPSLIFVISLHYIVLNIFWDISDKYEVWPMPNVQCPMPHIIFPQEDLDYLFAHTGLCEEEVQVC